VGRLREGHQSRLERLGLEWSMLSTTSWDAVSETLCSHVADAKKNGDGWDGDVPANFKTNDDPPRALGQWTDRQRSAFTKKKLKRSTQTSWVQSVWSGASTDGAGTD